MKHLTNAVLLGCALAVSSLSVSANEVPAEHHCKLHAHEFAKEHKLDLKHEHEKFAEAYCANNEAELKKLLNNNEDMYKQLEAFKANKEKK